MATFDQRLGQNRAESGEREVGFIGFLREFYEAASWPNICKALRRPPKAPRQRRILMVTNHIVSEDNHAQLRALYSTLLHHQERFDEFKQMLAVYQPGSDESGCENPESARLREHLNARISEWVDTRFDGLSAAQVIQWKAIVVEERINVCLSPWKESNMY